MVVVVDPDLTAREELFVREGKGRAPLPRRLPGALFAQKTPEAPEELVRRERGSAGSVLGVTLTAQEPGEVVEQPPGRGGLRISAGNRLSLAWPADSNPRRRLAGRPGQSSGEVRRFYFGLRCAIAQSTLPVYPEENRRPFGGTRNNPAGLDGRGR